MYDISNNKYQPQKPTKANIKISRAWSMPNANTFTIYPIEQLILKYIINLTNHQKEETKIKDKKIIVDPFANDCSMKKHIKTLNELKNNDIEYITNDLDDEKDTDYHLDALDFLKQFADNSVDMILYDPPYSPRQVSECYKKLNQTVNFQTTQSSYWTKQKKEISRILKNDGIVITFAWNSGGIGKKYNFDIEEILLVAHGSWHNDTIVTVERKNINTLF